MPAMMNWATDASNNATMPSHNLVRSLIDGWRAEDGGPFTPLAEAEGFDEDMSIFGHSSGDGDGSSSFSVEA